MSGIFLCFSSPGRSSYSYSFVYSIGEPRERSWPLVGLVVGDFGLVGESLSVLLPNKPPEKKPPV